MTYLAIPRLSVESLSTPLRLYHNEIKKTFKPFDQVSFKGRLGDLIIRIIYVVAMPVLYPATLTLAALGEGIKFGINIDKHSKAVRFASIGQYDQARQVAADTPLFMRNHVEKAICIFALRRLNNALPSDEKLQAATSAASRLTDDGFARAMFDNIVRDYIAKNDFANALEVIKMYTTHSLIIAESLIDSIVAKGEYHYIAQLLENIKACPDKFMFLFTAAISKKFISSNSTLDELKFAKDAILLMPIGDTTCTRIKHLIGIYILKDQINTALNFLDNLSDGFRVLVDQCRGKIVKELRFQLRESEAVDIESRYSIPPLSFADQHGIS
jgi:hypothetical protein